MSASAPAITVADPPRSSGRAAQVAADRGRPAGASAMRRDAVGEPRCRPADVNRDPVDRRPPDGSPRRRRSPAPSDLALIVAVGVSRPS